jgi:hypothetical protein
MPLRDVILEPRYEAGEKGEADRRSLDSYRLTDLPTYRNLVSHRRHRDWHQTWLRWTGHDHAHSR